MATLNVGNLGEYLREQRRTAQLSLRQLADAAGVSNPYLSQIERGLRKPSAEVLQQVAKALRISAETLYVRAGILDAERDGEERLREGATRAVILADPTLNERQKQVLLQIYESFRKENGFGTAPDGDVAAQVVEAVEAVAQGDGAVDAEKSDAGQGAGGAAADPQGSDTAVRRTRRKSPPTGGTRKTRTTRTSDGSDADPENPNNPQQSAG